MPAQITGALMDLFPHTIDVRRKLSASGFGDVTYGSIETVPARIIGRSQTVVGGDGQEYVCSVQAMLPGPYNFSTDDEFTLPEEFSVDLANKTDPQTRRPKPIAIDKESDENGLHHETVYFVREPQKRGF
jgi:hypothetical protein